MASFTHETIVKSLSVITGASSGIGGACARLFSEAKN